MISYASPCISRNLSRHRNLERERQSPERKKKSRHHHHHHKSRRTQNPRMTPFRNPHSAHISLTTTRNRLSPGLPYWPCIRTLNISTGLASTEFTAPAMAPAAAVSFSESCPNGEMMRFEMPYAPKTSEVTPAIPRRGLVIPSSQVTRRGVWVIKGKNGGWEARDVRTFVECQNALFAHCHHKDVHRSFLCSAVRGSKPEIE